MRALLLVLIVALATGAAEAAPAKKKSQSPPTAQPDTTLVTPDDAPPPPTYATSTRAVEMEPIGAPGAKTALAASPPPAVVAPPPPPKRPPQAPVVERAEACLRTEAPRAAHAETSVKQAVDLLIEDLCGGEVDGASLYAHNLDILAHFTPQSERAAAGLSGAKVDPETGEILNPPAGDVTGALNASGSDRSAVNVPPQLRKFAAELVLQAKSEAVHPAKAH